jgi:hypothetical protein
MPLLKILPSLISQGPFTGSFSGTSSYARRSLTASYVMGGAAGSSGTSGANGSVGSSGTSGTSATAGSSGTSGVGSPGTSGTAGTSGTSSTSSVQTGSLAKQTILYNVTSGSQNVITGLNLSGNKWGVDIKEEWDAKSVTGDEYYNSCSLLLHLNGSNGSTTFTDNSPTPKTPTSNNGAAISTAQSKFGGASLFLDGTDDYVTVPDNSGFDFGSGNFTIEYWEYRTSTTSQSPILTRNNVQYTPYLIGWYDAAAGGNVAMYMSSGGVSWDLASNVSMGALTTNVWTHYAVTRQGNTFRTFQNGIQISTFTSAAAFPAGSGALQIGRYFSSYYFKGGYIDELRITKGVARYTSNFTPQTSEFPNNSSLTQYATKYVGLIGGLNDRSVDYGIQKLSDTSLKVVKMTQTTSPFPSGSLSASVDRVYVNVLDYTKVSVTSSYSLLSKTASYALNASGGGSTLRTGSRYPITASRAITASYALNGGTALVNQTMNYVSGSNLYILSRSVVSPSDVLLSVNGIIQTPITDYTVSASRVTFTESYPSGSKINARYLVTATNSSDVNLANIVLTGTTTGDAYYPQVAALLHFDGTNGSTVITDNSKNNLAFTVNGDSKISTAQSKFGGASILFDGTGDYLTTPNNSLFDLSSSDFTIEFWFNTNTLTPSGGGSAGYANILGKQNWNGSAGAGWGVWQFNQTIVFFWPTSALNSISTGNVITAINTWYHIAVVRSGTATNNTKIYINGVQQAQGTSSSTNSTSALTIGGTNPTSGWDNTYYAAGYIDELRITKGYARYTGNFTPSTTAFSNTGGDVGKALVVNSTATGVSIGTAGFNLNSSNINRIINGAMAIDQRNAGASQTITAGAALAYTVDRWYAYCTGANVTGQRITGSANNQYAYRFTGAASVTAIGFGQRIEAANSFDLVGSTVTLGVDLANSVLTSVTWTVYYANTSDTFGTLASPTRTQISTGTFTVTSTLSRYSAQIFIPSAATTGIEIVFSVGAQTSGTWTIDNVQLEAGPLATPFERRLVGSELNLCYRYFVNLNGGTNTYQQLGFGTFYSSTNGAYIINLPTQMRTLPVVSSTGTIYILVSSNINLTGFLGPYSQIGTILEGDFTVASGGTVGTTGLIRWNNVSPSSRTFFVSAEL